MIFFHEWLQVENWNPHFRNNFGLWWQQVSRNQDFVVLRYFTLLLEEQCKSILFHASLCLFARFYGLMVLWAITDFLEPKKNMLKVTANHMVHIKWNDGFLTFSAYIYYNNCNGRSIAHTYTIFFNSEYFRLNPSRDGFLASVNLGTQTLFENLRHFSNLINNLHSQISHLDLIT